MKPNAAPRLVASGITVTRGSRRIVDNADLTLNAGEFTILAGPNGAGKTTLARAMAGVMRTEGSIAF
ncbi:MAG: ATP-binding cassette domain-containing protein, partial [Afipia sp.]